MTLQIKNSNEKNPQPDALSEAAECLKVLGHPARLKILFLLAKHPLTVGELAEKCGLKSNHASDHLRLMQRCGFLSVRRESTKAFYEIAEPHIFDLLRCVKSRFLEENS